MIKIKSSKNFTISHIFDKNQRKIIVHFSPSDTYNLSPDALQDELRDLIVTVFNPSTMLVSLRFDLGKTRSKLISLHTHFIFGKNIVQFEIVLGGMIIGELHFMQETISETY